MRLTFKCLLITFLLAGLCFWPLSATAQTLGMDPQDQPTDSDRTSSLRTHRSLGLPLQPALTPDRMIELLSQNSTLNRQIKHLLVQRASDRGMFVDESQVSDEILFRLIKQDPRVAAAVGREIQKNGFKSSSEATGVKRIRPDELGDGLAMEEEASADSSSAAEPPTSNLPQPRQAANTGSPPAPKQTVDQKQQIPSFDLVYSRRSSPYANVPSYYDLYNQTSTQPAELQRFGTDIFRNVNLNKDNLPMDLPVGPDYVVGPGDTLSIELWGSVSETLQRVVDREGRVSLPETGSILVAGRTLTDVQHDVQTSLRKQFRDVKVDVSLARLRTVRVYIVGDVANPGAYDISSLSTPLNALATAGGPTDRGSMRVIRHYRGKQLIQEVDIYDLILSGVRSDVKRLEPGDSLLVQPIGSQVTVEGSVRRPAIYELREEKSLAEILALAGGVLPTGTVRHINVTRIEAHEKRSMLSLDVPATNDEAAINKLLADFKIQDGDAVRIAPILPYSFKTVYLDGHVFRPGKYPYQDGMKISDLIRSYEDLLPEPAQHAEVIRLNPPDFRPTVVGFALSPEFAKGDQNLPLQPFDTVRVFSRFDFEDDPIVTVVGQVRQPGEHRMNGATYLRDAIHLAGGLTPDAFTEDAEVYRKVNDSNIKILSANLGKALSGDSIENILLLPKDKVVVHGNLAQVDPATVFIHGDVASPGEYPLGVGMTATQLVKLAGGFTRGAYLEKADLSRFTVENGQKVVTEHRELQIAQAMSGDASADVALHEGDVLAIREMTGWKDIGASIKVEGEVAHPGTYGIREGERLSSIIRRAGGFRSTAYPAGAVMERVQIRQIAQENRAKLIDEIESQPVESQVDITTPPQVQIATNQALQQERQQILARLKSEPVSGRLVITLTPNINQWANKPADIEVRAGDVLTVPKKPNFVMVTGEVYNRTAISYAPGRNAGWYLRQAGGPTELARKKAIFVVRANGSVVSNGNGGWWSGNVLGERLQPGDSVVVPEKITAKSSIVTRLLQSAQTVLGAARVATIF